jgi:FMN-dependent NADH-azoreductase
MKKVLFINCSIRDDHESRTTTLAKAFMESLDSNYEITELTLKNLNLKPLVGEFFEERQALLEQGNFDHPRFDYAKQFQQADLIVVAAPFWDLSFPALFKIYIENVSLDGITFGASEDGLVGLCKASDLVYLTTRGGIYKDDPMESALPQVENLCKFFGIDAFHAIAADGMDIVGYDAETSLKEACEQASQLAKSL